MRYVIIEKNTAELLESKENTVEKAYKKAFEKLKKERLKDDNR